MKKFLLAALAIAVCSASVFAGGGGQSSNSGVIEVTIPHYKSGENVGARFFLPQVERFNQRYSGRYKLNVEELVQDMYLPRLQQLAIAGRLPALIEGGNDEWIKEFIIPQNMFVDMRDVYENSPEIKAYMAPESVAYNTHNGKLFSISSLIISPVGLYYNPRLYQPSRPMGQMTWEQVSAELGANNKIAFMTSENAWTTMLTLSSLIAAEPGGVAWLASGARDNPRLVDYNNPIMINAVTKLQQLLQRNASANTLGAAYADAANSFMSARSAIIANGPWMVDNFLPAGSGDWSNGFNGADVRGDVFPGNITIGGPPVGFLWWIPSTATAREQELAKAFVTFMMTQDELERQMLMMGGTIPAMTPSASFLAQRESENKLMAEYMGASGPATVSAENFGGVIPNSVSQTEFGRLLPLLINGTYTPARFCQELTDRAQETLR